MSKRPKKTAFARRALPSYIQMASGVSLAAAMATPCVAQSAQNGEENPEKLMEEIVVTAQKQNIMTANEIKRDADQFVDSIVTTDIGKLPDRSITEALQRVPGVSVSRYDDLGDPEHFAGEGSGVVVRGLSQVRSSLNGLDVFSANGGRALSFDDVPAELMAGVDTYKSPTADMIEGGLGGMVNLRTRMPFDLDGQLISTTIKANYGDQIKETNDEYSALYSNHWETGLGEIGFLLNLSVSDLSSRADNIYTRAYSPSTNGGETTWVPRGVDWRRNDYERERNGQYLALQWAPNDNLEVYVTGFRSEHKQRWDEAAFFIDGSFDVNSISESDDWVYDSRGALVSGTLSGNVAGIGSTIPFGTSTRFSANTAETTDYALGITWQATDKLTVKADLQRVGSTSDKEDYTLGLVAFPESIQVSNLNSTPSVSADESFLSNPTNFSYGQMMSIPSDNEGDSTAARLDLEYDFENSIVQSVQAGARYSDKSATNREANNWSARYQPWTSWLYPFPGADTNDLILYSYGDFQRGDVNVPSSAFLLTSSLLRDFRGTTDRIVANTDGCCAPNFDALDLNAPQNINKQDETTEAIYAKVNFALNDLAMPIDGNLGLRYVRTENIAGGHFNTQLSTVTAGSEAEGNQTTYVLLPASSQEYSAKHDYTNVLPSLNLRILAGDDLIFRFAASKGLWRPEFWRLKAYLNLSANIAEGVTLGDPADITEEFLVANTEYSLSTKETNPFLEPMEANQYDLSAEWYFDDNSGLVHMGLFKKDISKYFVVHEETTVVNGFTAKSKWIDNEGTADIRGAEIGLTKFFDFLPEPWDGFGIQANYTYIDSSLDGPEGTNTDGSGYGDLPAEGISERIYNLVGMYEKYGFYARLAYNWRSEYLVSVGPNGWNGSTDGVDWRLPIYNDDYGQLDLSMGYNINDNISVNVEASNITKEDTVGLMDQGVIGKQHAYTYSQDVRYAASLRMTF